jgi:hypothetical protein
MHVSNPNPDEQLDQFLGRLNRSELVQVARAAGLGNVSRDSSRESLVVLLLTEEGLGADTLQERRVAMQAHIERHRNRLLSQLPGCSGKCTTFGCPDLIVMRCWGDGRTTGFSRDML